VVKGVVADVLLRRGRIWCGREAATASALAVFEGRVLATGGDELDALVGPDTHVVDLEGRFAAPGLYDAHLHLLPLGLAMADLDLRAKSAPALADILGAVRAKAARTPPGTWILGRGYDHAKLDVKRHPTRRELDAVAPDHPVYLSRTCGHLAVCNSKALEQAGITAQTPSPPGGLIEVEDGELTGLLAETGRNAVQAVLPDVTAGDLVGAVKRGGDYCASFGITSVMDAAVGMRMGFEEIAAYHRAKREGLLPVRVDLCLLGGEGGIVERCFEAGLVTGTGDAELMVGPVKIFTDGSAGGRTAAMREPYLGGGHGLLTLEDAVLDGFVRDYHERGYQMAIHAIGDGAIEQVLNAYDRALAAKPWPERRHRIEHCGFNDEAQIRRLVALGVEPVPQPVFMYDFGDLYVDLLGETRAAAAYPMRRWTSAGLHPAASSDCPVSDCDPFPNLYTMTTRRTDRGTVLGGQEALTAEEALAAYTYNGAYVGRAEHLKGRLVRGQLADVAVFDTDLLQAEPDAVREATCELTLKGGEVVFDRHGLAG
jgi:predicted amidohydrolase YtcJ